MTVIVGPRAVPGEEPVLVEVDPVTSAGIDSVYDGVDTRGSAADRVLEVARDVYEDGLDLARRCARQAMNGLGDLGEGLRPDEVELQVSIKLDAALGAVLVKSGAEAQLQVTFRWQPGGGT